MDFNDTPKEAAFRGQARAWLAVNAPKFVPPSSSKGGEFDDLPLARAWQAAKAEARFTRMTWPEAFGGRGTSPMEDLIFDEEERKYKLPSDPFAISLGLCITTLMAHAPADVLARFVPAALRGDEIWCQLFSEPSAGSDLGNVRTRAVRDGDDWVVTGQKVWTSGAHVSDWGTLLVRTDPTVEKYQGLSYFYVDMKSPGIEIRPIRQASGHFGFNEVFFNEVRVPHAQRLGEIGEGWKGAIATLMNERMSVNEGTIGDINIDDVVNLARRTNAGGGRPIDNPVIRARLAALYVRSTGVRYTRYRQLTALSRGQLPGPEAALGKAVLGLNIQAMAKLGMEFYGQAGVLCDLSRDAALAKMQGAWLSAAGLRIAGGTDEILKNTIAERVLGLPSEIRVDRNIPFNQLQG